MKAHLLARASSRRADSGRRWQAHREVASILPGIRIPATVLRCVALGVCFELIAHTATARSIQGTATYRERMGVPPAAGQTAPANPAAARPLEGTYWKAVELAGKPAPTQAANREAHIVFQGGNRLSGADGCNRIAGRYELKGESVSFGEVTSTRMACIDTGETERAFREALKAATRLTIAGDRLELFDATATRVAAFSATTQSHEPPTSRAKVFSVSMPTNHQ